MTVTTHSAFCSQQEADRPVKIQSGGGFGNGNSVGRPANKVHVLGIVFSAAELVAALIIVVGIPVCSQSPAVVVRIQQIVAVSGADRIPPISSVTDFPPTRISTFSGRASVSPSAEKTAGQPTAVKMTAIAITTHNNYILIRLMIFLQNADMRIVYLIIIAQLSTSGNTPFLRNGRSDPRKSEEKLIFGGRLLRQRQSVFAVSANGFWFADKAEL